MCTYGITKDQRMIVGIVKVGDIFHKKLIFKIINFPFPFYLLSLSLYNTLKEYFFSVVSW
jgi:hypothetical protein